MNTVKLLSKAVKILEVDRKKSRRRYFIENLSTGKKEWMTYEKLNLMNDGRGKALIRAHNREFSSTPKSKIVKHSSLSASKASQKVQVSPKKRRTKSLGTDAFPLLSLPRELVSEAPQNNAITKSKKQTKKSNLQESWNPKKYAAKRVLMNSKRVRNTRANKPNKVPRTQKTRKVTCKESNEQFKSTRGRKVGFKVISRKMSPNRNVRQLSATKDLDSKGAAKMEQSPSFANQGAKRKLLRVSSSDDVKRKRRGSISSTSSEETLYSLPEAYVPIKRPKLPVHTLSGKHLKALLLSSKTDKVSSASSSAASSDSEITFKTSVPSSSPAKKEGVKSRSYPGMLESGDLSCTSTSSSLQPAAPKSPPSATLIPPSSFRLTPDTEADSPSNTSSPLRLMPNSLGARQDPVLAPASPTAPRYESLLKTLQSRQKTWVKRGQDAEGTSVGMERRLSVRQSESAFKYKEIVVKKAEAYTHVTLACHTKTKNSLNPKVIQELLHLLHGVTYDNTRVVLLTGSGNVFCSGVDLHYLLESPDRKAAAKAMSNSLKELVSALLTFPKPLVAAVNGSAIGLGVALLPLCDMVYASDKATFCCPYTQLGQTPEACASYTFPQTVGMAMTNELLLLGRKVTAMEANQCGLVSQVFWPTSLMQDVIPRVTQLATHSSHAIEASKLLIRSHQRHRLDAVNISETQMLCERWASTECQRSIKAYLESDTDR